jgi:hypothetical protein
MGRKSITMKLGFVWAILFFLIGCAQTQDRSFTEYMAEMNPDNYSAEIARLETVISKNPDSSGRWQAHLQLAQLYISYKNPRRNYQKALENLRLYYPHHPISEDDHDLRNWLSALKEIGNQGPRLAAQSKKIEQLTAKLKMAKQANLALKKENEALKADKLRLTNTNGKLKRDNQELAMKIDMLKILDRRVEEKRQNYTSD